MKLSKKIQNIILLLFAWLGTTPVIFAKDAVNTAGLKIQDTALMKDSGLAANVNLAVIISILIKSVLGFLGVIFLVLTIMAGFKWMNSQGNEDEIKKAKESLTNSIIGLIIVLAAYSITYGVFTYLPFGGSLTIN